MRDKVYAVFTVSLACFFWSISFSVSKILLKQVSPFELAFIRFLLAGIFSSLLFFPKIKRIPFKWEYHRPLFLAGLLGVTLYFVFENSGLKFTSASEAALLVGAFPIFGLVMEIFKEKKDPPLNRIIGIILSFIGVILILGNTGINLKIQNLIGDFLVLLSGVSWVIYNWEIKKVNHKYPYEVITTFQLFYGTILFIPFLLFTGLRIPKGIENILGIFYLAFFCSSFGYLLYNYGLKKLSVSQVVNLLNLVPLFGALWGIIFLKETLGIFQILGGFLIIMGVSLTTWR
jgi:drug/metabolite transporter (DMT)-like permease